MYFRIFTLKNEPQYKIHNHFHLKDESSGEYYQFSYDNDFRKLIRMMSGVNTDLRTSIPPLYSTGIKSVLVDLIDYGIFPLTNNNDSDILNKFCYVQKNRMTFLEVMAKEICR